MITASWVFIKNIGCLSRACSNSRPDPNPKRPRGKSPGVATLRARGLNGLFQGGRRFYFSFHLIFETHPLRLERGLCFRHLRCAGCGFEPGVEFFKKAFTAVPRVQRVSQGIPRVPSQGCQISIIAFMSAIFPRITLSVAALDLNTATRRLTAEPVSPKISPSCELVRTPSCQAAYSNKSRSKTRFVETRAAF